MKKYFCFCIVVCCVIAWGIFNAYSSTVVGVCKHQTTSVKNKSKEYGKAMCINDNVCGYGCDKDGKNCKYGYCNVSDCNKAKGYVGLSYRNAGKITYKGEMLCYNPNTKLSYESEKNGKVKFYKDGYWCGDNCDLDGGNCKQGFCNAAHCNQEYGYTDLKRIGDTFRCYNPITQIAYGIVYGKDMYFYKNSGVCGIKCDMNGKNCETGNCTSVCNEKDGYIQTNDKCYNPKSGLSYVNNYEIKNNKLVLNNVRFWLNDEYCGENCDYLGQNCSSGFCNVASCNIQKGYTQLKKVTDRDDSRMICYNPSEQRGYYKLVNGQNQFYVNGYRCGYKCDYDGQNCAVESEARYGNFIGICNVQDCPNGYKIVPDYFKAHGFCAKENGTTVLLGADKKFHSASKTQIFKGIKNGVEGAAFFVTYPFTGD